LPGATGRCRTVARVTVAFRVPRTFVIYCYLTTVLRCLVGTFADSYLYLLFSGGVVITAGVYTLLPNVAVSSTWFGPIFQCRTYERACALFRVPLPGFRAFLLPCRPSSSAAGCLTWWVRCSPYRAVRPTFGSANYCIPGCATLHVVLNLVSCSTPAVGYFFELGCHVPACRCCYLPVPSARLPTVLVSAGCVDEPLRILVRSGVVFAFPGFFFAAVFVRCRCVAAHTRICHTLHRRCRPFVCGQVAVQDVCALRCAGRCCRLRRFAALRRPYIPPILVLLLFRFPWVEPDCWNVSLLFWAGCDVERYR